MLGFAMGLDADKLGIILFAHGSAVEDANQGVLDLASEVGKAGRFHFACAAFLDCAHPNLGEAIAEAVGAGSARIIVIPYFLTMGVHLRRDLPNLIAPERQKYSSVTINVGPSLEGHPLMCSLILERIGQALSSPEAAE